MGTSYRLNNAKQYTLDTMSDSLPSTMRACVIGKAEGKPGQVYHPISVKDVPTPTSDSKNECIVKIYAAGLNHREVWLRKSLYPGLQFDSILGADGAGIVVSPSSHPLYKKAVLLSSHVGWRDSVYGPDQSVEFGILGGVKQTQGRGTFGEYIKMATDDLVPVPTHLLERKDSWELAGGIPLGALTAYRAVFTKGELEKGQNVLITGIGGGVAIQALQFAVAIGANAFVTSGSEEKIEKAKKLGAVGGVNYKEDKWSKKLAELLPKDRPYLDAVVDSGGGDITTQLVKLLKHGARVSTYGQTTGKPHTFGMAEVLKNIELRGSTMGSLAEFKAAVALINKHKIVPVVDSVYSGLTDENVEAMCERMKKGAQFGKLVLKIVDDGDNDEAKKGKL